MAHSPTYLLLGGAGFLGANLASILVAHGARVIVYERPGADLSRLSKLESAVEVVQGVFTEKEKLYSLIASRDVKVVVHLVSGLLPSSAQSEYLRELDDVVVPTFALIRYCAELKIRFVFFSTGGAIYGEAGGERLPESHILSPISYYGLSKVQIEEYIRFEGRSSGLDYLILRPSNPYGRFQSLTGRQGFVSVAFGKILRQEPIEIWGDGSAIRDYIQIKDLVQAFWDLEKASISDTTINIGSGVGHSLLEVIDAIEKVMHHKANIRFLPARSVDVKSVVLDIGLLQSVVDFVPTDLFSGITMYYVQLRGIDAESTLVDSNPDI